MLDVLIRVGGTEQLSFHSLKNTGHASALMAVPLLDYQGAAQGEGRKHEYLGP